MAYTRSWDDATPAGTRAASQIDDAIRELKVDIHERMNDLVVDWEADPVEPQGKIGGEANKLIVIHGAQFQIDTDETADYSGSGILVSGTAPPIRCPLVLPVGIEITLLRWLITTNSTRTWTFELKRRTFTTGLTETTINSQTQSAAATVIKSSGAISHTVQSGFSYYLEADANGILTDTLQLHAVEIGYTTPDARSTL